MPPSGRAALLGSVALLRRTDTEIIPPGPPDVNGFPELRLWCEQRGPDGSGERINDPPMSRRKSRPRRSAGPCRDDTAWPMLCRQTGCLRRLCPAGLVEPRSNRDRTPLISSQDQLETGRHHRRPRSCAAYYRNDDMSTGVAWQPGPFSFRGDAQQPGENEHHAGSPDSAMLAAAPPGVATTRLVPIKPAPSRLLSP
jgi:hypothetical protein